MQVAKDKIIEKASEGVIVVDEDKKFLYANEKAKEILPYLAGDDIDAINERNEQYGLEFTPNDINYIIVEKESEILEIMDAIQRIKSRHPYEDVKLLSTRIISMERITEDF